MGKKFVIECPRCGRYSEASTGFFAKKKIDCACGNTINVRTDKMALTDCPSCGNSVLYDQSKGEDALCPVCHAKVNLRESKALLTEFSCPSCACKLSTDKTAAFYTCPLCDTEIDVQERIAKETVKKRGDASVIKYEGGNDIFVWKHPIEDFNLGSQLIVHESQEALFFCDGRAMDLFGSGRYTLASEKLPMLNELYKFPSMDVVFHSEIYFINMVTQMGIKWGTDSKVRLFDPASGMYVEIGACGTFNLRVCNSRKLVLKLVGTTSELSQGDLSGAGCGTSTMVGKFRSLIMNKVKSNLARAIKENDINILEIDSYMDVLSDKLRVIINDILEDYGLFMPEFFITSVLLPDDDPNFRRMKQQFGDKTLRVREEQIKYAEAEAAHGRKILEAQTEAQLKMVGAQGDAEAMKIRAMAEADAYRAQAFAEADEMRAKGYTYQQETVRQVGLEAMKNGVTGNGGGGMFGDVVSMGVTMGTMGSMVDMTKEALNPIARDAMDMGRAVGGQGAGWSCACGQTGITSNFCPNCGQKKPAPAAGWTCSCGQADITSNFCPNCGQKKPAPAAGWTCSCGQTDITSNFCPNCGAKKGE